MSDFSDRHARFPPRIPIPFPFVVGESLLGQDTLEAPIGVVTVGSIYPSGLAQGVTSLVLLTGTDFDRTDIVGFSGTGIVVNSATFVSARTIVLNLTVLLSAIVSTRTVTVGTAMALFDVTPGTSDLSDPFWIEIIPD